MQAALGSWTADPHTAWRPQGRVFTSTRKKKGAVASLPNEALQNLAKNKKYSLLPEYGETNERNKLKYQFSLQENAATCIHCF